jgi:hypothetical protein
LNIAGVCAIAVWLANNALSARLTAQTNEEIVGMASNLFRTV